MGHANGHARASVSTSAHLCTRHMYRYFRVETPAARVETAARGDTSLDLWDGTHMACRTVPRLEVVKCKHAAAPEL